MDDLLKDLGSKIDTIKENQGTTKEVIDTLKSEVNALKEKASSDEATTKRLQELSEEVSQIKEISMNPIFVPVKTIGDNIKTFFTENQKEIMEIKRRGTGYLEIKFDHSGNIIDDIVDGRVVSKAVGTITTGNITNISVPNTLGAQIAPPSRANLREIPVLNLVTTINTNLANLPYTEVEPKDGDALFTAEGTAKPKADFTSKTRFASPKKVAIYEQLTEETVTDIPQMMSIAQSLLFDKHNLRKAKGILIGDGTGENPIGATTTGRLFVAGSMALAISNPNIMDIINACRTDIATTHNFQDETPYIANLVALNPVDYMLQLLSIKDGFGRPLYPEAMFNKSVTINDVTIIQDEVIPVGKILVCDMSKYNVSNYVPYSVRIGMINDDFILNQFCMVGESRAHFFVKNLDKKAFIYDSIATIKTAITKV